jgi:UDP-glucose 4-epimerase
VNTLVTGGAGCIGSVLAEVLVKQGRNVRVLDNLSSGRRENLDGLRHLSNFEFVEADMLDRRALEQALSGVEMVFHLAANPDVKYSPGDPTDKDLQQNTLATYYLLDAMRLRGVRRLAFASTSAVYGISDRQPIPEDQPLRPISLYGASKLACEGLMSAFGNLFQIQCWVLRFANIVGARVRKSGRTVISDFIHKLQADPRHLQILGDGRQEKSYLSVEECVDAMLYVVEHAGHAMNVYNLGCTDSLNVVRIADMVCDAMGLSGVEYSFTGTAGGWPGDVPRFTLDVTRINRLGWRSRKNSEQAIAMAIDAIMEGQTVG